MSVTEEKGFFKPFAYPWAFEAYLKQHQVHWLPEEVPMADDRRDFYQKLTEEERNLVTQILRFFTQGDADIASAYHDRYIPMLKNEEIRMMLGAFADFEAIHAHAYSELITTVGLPDSEFKAFQDIAEMQEKHDYMFNRKLEGLSEIEKTLVDIAVFSAFGEGLQLFSSFAILMNFPRFNKLKGLGQIVRWSVRDETMHIAGMIRVFKELVRENHSVWTDELKAYIYEACRGMVECEDRFINKAFELGDIEGLTKDDMKRYIRYIADRRLLQLGLKPNYGVKDNPLEWFEEVLNAVEHTNFFENRATAYSKAATQGDWDDAFE